VGDNKRRSVPRTSALAFSITVGCKTAISKTYIKTKKQQEELNKKKGL